MADALVLTLSGNDKPGVTAGLNAALSHLPVHITQLEQIVLQGHLVLGIVLSGDEIAHPDLYAKVIATAEQYAQDRDMHVTARHIPDSELDH